MRVLRNLQSATFGPTPSFIVPKRYTHIQKKGLLFEKKVGKDLGRLHPSVEILKGPWIYYEDSMGKAVCQPDILLNPPDLPLYIIECKLSYKEAAEDKLLTFYRPILEKLYSKPICCVQACRNLKGYDDQTYLLQEILSTDNPYMVVHHP